MRGKCLFHFTQRMSGKCPELKGKTSSPVWRFYIWFKCVVELTIYVKRASIVSAHSIHSNKTYKHNLAIRRNNKCLVELSTSNSYPKRTLSLYCTGCVLASIFMVGLFVGVLCLCVNPQSRFESPVRSQSVVRRFSIRANVSLDRSKLRHTCWYNLYDGNCHRFSGLSL